MSELLRRLRQRKLVQWVVGYLAAAWIALEVVSTFSETWGWSPLVGRMAFVSLGTGLGWTIVLAWYHGERGEQRASTTELALLGALLATGTLGAVVVFRGGVPENAGSPMETTAAPVADARSLVVLPFTDLSPGGGRDYLGDGIAETLISGLGRIDELRVVARTSAFQFKGQGLDVREIARRLGVGSVLEGSVAQVAGRVRITANLVDAQTGLDLWSNRFDEEMDTADLFVLQDEVAQAILDALEIELGGARQVVGRGTRHPEAQRAYFLGMHHWARRTTRDIARATEYFREAIEADSLYAEAWGGLALAYVLHIPSEYGVPGLSPTEALDRTERAAQRAIELDSTLAAPHAALGWAYKSRARPDEAERQFRLGIAKSPGYATAHHWLADLLLMRLRADDALREIEIAESLDPVAPPILVEKAQVLMTLGRYEEATAQLDRSLELLPDASLVLSYAAWFALILDEWDRAASLFERRLTLAGEDPEAILDFVAGLRDPELRPGLLRRLADGRGPSFPSVRGAESFSSPQSRFFVMLKVDGTEAALEYLESAIRGPERADLYGPMLPAAMGPEIGATREAQRIMQLLVEVPEG